MSNISFGNDYRESSLNTHLHASQAEQAEENIINNLEIDINITQEDPVCKAYKCKYPHTHVTSKHRCMKCNKDGHGQSECNNDNKMMYLEQFKFDIMPEKLWCISRDCQDYWTHITYCHICHLCGEYHIIDVCPLLKKNIFLNRIKYNKNLQEDKIIENDNWCKSRCCNNYWTHTTENHICNVCDERHVNENCPSHALKKLYENKKNMENNVVYQVKCPICRVISFCSNTQSKILGLSQECHLCCTNTINFCFPNCKHATCCEDCVQKMKTDIQEPINAEDPNLIPNLKMYGNYEFRFFEEGFCYFNTELSNGKIAYIKKTGKFNDPEIMIFNKNDKKYIHKFLDRSI